jgi:hypothetical protein
MLSFFEALQAAHGDNGEWQQPSLKQAHERMAVSKKDSRCNRFFNHLFNQPML